MRAEQLRDAICTATIRFMLANEYRYSPDSELAEVVQEFLVKFLRHVYVIEPEDIPLPAPDLQTSLDIEETRLIEAALKRAHGCVAEAAHELGLKSRGGLYRKMQRLNIERKRTVIVPPDSGPDIGGPGSPDSGDLNIPDARPLGPRKLRSNPPAGGRIGYSGAPRGQW
jgi:hypothetical protein